MTPEFEKYIIEIVEQLKLDEGFTTDAFWDIKQWTYGYGTRAVNGEGSKITREEALPLLISMTRDADSDLQRLMPATYKRLDIVRKQALVNMVFNMGIGSFSKFTRTLAEINKEKQDWKLIAQYARDSKWFKQVGARSIRICNELETGVKFVKPEVCKCCGQVIKK